MTISLPRIGLIASLLGSAAIQAGPLDIPHTFAPNTPAVAAEVNQNFSAVEVAVDDNDSRIAALEAMYAAQQATITALQYQLDTIQNNSVLELDGALVLGTDPATGQPTARFIGVNVQVVNGTGAINTMNGLGNLIIGYNGGTGSTAFCSNGDHDNQSDCENAGFVWATDQRSGSHNLIIGNRNAYTSYGGLLAGFDNIINNKFASVSGGQENLASGQHASVTGGFGNTASGPSAVVSGGYENIASGPYASVSGGQSNVASGPQSSVSGGLTNTASSSHTSISGGRNNVANHESASVSGGHDNIAEADYASVSGGQGNSASGESASVSGGKDNTASGTYASVGGGEGNTASGESSSVSGGLSRSVSGQYDWRAGTLFEGD